MTDIDRITIRFTFILVINRIHNDIENNYSRICRVNYRRIESSVLASIILVLIYYYSSKKNKRSYGRHKNLCQSWLTTLVSVSCEMLSIENIFVALLFLRRFIFNAVFLLSLLLSTSITQVVLSLSSKSIHNLLLLLIKLAILAKDVVKKKKHRYCFRSVFGRYLLISQ
jgi:hypothetical protein